MKNVFVSAAYGGLILVTLATIISSFVIPNINDPAMGHRGSYQELSSKNGYYIPGIYNDALYNPYQNDGVSYNAYPLYNAVNGVVSAGTSAADKLYSVSVYNSAISAGAQIDLSVAAMFGNGDFFAGDPGVARTMVTAGPTVDSVGAFGVETPQKTATISSASRTKRAADVPRKTRASQDDSLPYPLITGAWFTTGAPDFAAVTASP